MLGINRSQRGDRNVGAPENEALLDPFSDSVCHLLASVSLIQAGA